MRKTRIHFDRHTMHLDMGSIHPGDVVIGSLPVNLVAEVCARGATYRHLSLQIDAANRGQELSADELDDYDATLTTYEIKPQGEDPP
jgi:CRISPR-associated protein Csx16